VIHYTISSYTIRSATGCDNLRHGTGRNEQRESMPGKHTTTAPGSKKARRNLIAASSEERAIQEEA